MINKLIAVYGSLLTGLGNHPVIAEGELLGEEVVEIPFTMADLGSFPGLISAKENHAVKIEVYSCNPETYRRVERLEGYPSFYDKAVINTIHGDAEVYFLANGYSNRDSIKKINGVFDWRSHIMEKRKSYTY